MITGDVEHYRIPSNDKHTGGLLYRSPLSGEFRLWYGDGRYNAGLGPPSQGGVPVYMRRDPEFMLAWAVAHLDSWETGCAFVDQWHESERKRVEDDNRKWRDRWEAERREAAIEKSRAASRNAGRRRVLRETPAEDREERGKLYDLRSKLQTVYKKAKQGK
jgi:hypothetical protein